MGKSSKLAAPPFFFPFIHSLIAAAPQARFALVGPSTPLTPRLHGYGADLLAGMVIEDARKAARIVAEGGSVKALKTVARMVTLRDTEMA